MYGLFTIISVQWLWPTSLYTGLWCWINSYLVGYNVTVIRICLLSNAHIWLHLNVLIPGENVEPAELEEAASRSNLIDQIMVIGQVRQSVWSHMVNNKIHQWWNRSASVLKERTLLLVLCTGPTTPWCYYCSQQWWSSSSSKKKVDPWWE